MKCKKIYSLLACAILATTLTACDNKPKQAGEAPAPTATQEAAPQGGEQQAPAASVKGTAKEVLAGGGFTYILVADSQGDIWVAVPETEIAVGETVSVTDGQLMQNFPSKSLERTFDELVFSSALEGKAPKGAGGSPHGAPMAASSPHGQMGAGGGDFSAALEQEAGGAQQAIDPGGVTPGSGKAIVPFVDLKVEKASGEGSFTVGELFAKYESLNGQKVRVKGQVVKVSPQIMGKNWLHIQDGTGDPMSNTHDLVVTTAAQAEKGDIVTVEGTLAANKDFGFGYKYNVIVEDVAVSK